MKVGVVTFPGSLDDVDAQLFADWLRQARTLTLAARTESRAAR